MWWSTSPPTYAEAVENDKVVRRYRVIVGKTEKPSPTLTAEITNVNLNPTWTVPPSIAKNEIVGAYAQGPELSRRACTCRCWMPTTTRSIRGRWTGFGHAHAQLHRAPASGSWNALGAVRIDMPNSYSVYMHDTNQRNLFSDDYRFDSHGCARVDNVRDLAAWLLKDKPQWGRAEIDADIATGQHPEVAIAEEGAGGLGLPHRRG